MIVTSEEKDLDRHSPETPSPWETLAKSPETLVDAQILAVHNNHILILGSWNNNKNWDFSIITNDYQRLPSFPKDLVGTLRAHCVIHVPFQNAIYSFGGWNTNHCLRRKYDPNDAQSLHESNHSALDDDELDAKGKEFWDNVAHIRYIDTPDDILKSFGKEVEAAIGGDDGNLIVTTGGSKMPKDVTVFDTNTNTYIDIFQDVLPEETVNHGMVVWTNNGKRVVNQWLIWNNEWAYRLIYNEALHSINTVKCDSVSFKWDTFAYCVARDCVIAFGGWNNELSSGDAALDTIHIFSFETEKWVESSVKLPQSRFEACAVLSVDCDYIHIIGGLNQKREYESQNWRIRVDDLVVKYSPLLIEYWGRIDHIDLNRDVLHCIMIFCGTFILV